MRSTCRRVLTGTPFRCHRNVVDLAANLDYFPAIASPVISAESGNSRPMRVGLQYHWKREVVCRVAEGEAESEHEDDKHVAVVVPKKISQPEATAVPDGWAQEPLELVTDFLFFARRACITIEHTNETDGHVSPADSNAAGPSGLPLPQDAAIETTEAGSKNSGGVSPPPPAAAEPVDIVDQVAPTSRVRVPCYGWISGGGDDSDDVKEFDILVPASEPETETCKKGQQFSLPPRKRHR